MVQHLIVPVDGSDASWRAADVAVGLARRCDADVEIVEVIFDDDELADSTARLADRADQHGYADVVVTTTTLLAAESVADALACQIEAHPESMVVMSSHGRGRSAALLGSVTEELLQLTFGPMLVVGPHVADTRFDGPIVVAVDGSKASETVLPLAAAWGIELGVEPWIVEVAAPDVQTGGDVAESAYPARLARKLASQSGHPVQFDVLHGRDVHAQVADFADSMKASMIVASTHGRTGLARFVIGSTVAAIVRHAGCPVLLVRPPHLPRS
jgi:nucleotide-binding universal stress UspA family protein